MKEIPLTQGKVALVDDEDFEVLSAFKWFAHRGGRTFYAHRNVHRHGGGQTSELLHRLVLAWALGRPLTKGDHCDHVNGDGLDNRRENLRIATKAQNARNCQRHGKNLSSQYLGVSWKRASGKWQALVQVPGKNVYLGLHATELDAAQAREMYIIAHPELHARSNFPKETSWTPA